jgi:hypothetical protein
MGSFYLVCCVCFNGQDDVVYQAGFQAHIQALTEILPGPPVSAHCTLGQYGLGSGGRQIISNQPPVFCAGRFNCRFAGPSQIVFLII